MNRKFSARTKSFIPSPVLEIGQFPKLLRSNILSFVFYHLTTFMLSVCVFWNFIEKYSLIITFTAWVVLCFYFFLFFFYLINILMRLLIPSFLYYLLKFSLVKVLNCISISSLASTFQDVIYYTTNSVVQLLVIYIIIGIINIDPRH
jgi:hypothetical protein